MQHAWHSCSVHNTNIYVKELKTGVVAMLTLSLPVAPVIVVTTTSGSTGDDNEFGHHDDVRFSDTTTIKTQRFTVQAFLI